MGLPLLVIEGVEGRWTFYRYLGACQATHLAIEPLYRRGIRIAQLGKPHVPHHQ